MPIKLFSFKRTAMKLAAGGLFLVVLFASGWLFTRVSAVAQDAQLDDHLEAACANLRELSGEPLESCESELEAERPGLGGYYGRKLQCLAALESLEAYPDCKDFEKLKAYPES